MNRKDKERKHERRRAHTLRLDNRKSAEEITSEREKRGTKASGSEFQERRRVNTLMQRLRSRRKRRV